jgi:peroxiredoxin
MVEMVGRKIPDVTFKTRVRDESIEGPNPYRWQNVTTADLFRSKRVVLFSLPGAFTPTCSTYQLPGFEAMYDEFVGNHIVDDIYCISVNDAFVMNAWARQQGVEKVKMIPDGNAEFTFKMSMLVDKNNLGFGRRSWRYAAVVTQEVVEAWFEEPGIVDNAADDPYGVSSPENVMQYLNAVATKRERGA